MFQSITQLMKNKFILLFIPNGEGGIILYLGHYHYQ